MLIQTELFTNDNRKVTTKIVNRESKPKLSYESLLSEIDIKQNGLYYLRSLLKQYRNKDQKKYLNIIKSEIKFKKGVNNLKNILKEAFLFYNK